MKITDTKAKPKPNPVDRPLRTAHTTVRLYDSTQRCSTVTVLLILPFLQTNITSQMWPSGSKAGTDVSVNISAAIHYTLKCTNLALKLPPFLLNQGRPSHYF